MIERKVRSSTYATAVATVVLYLLAQIPAVAGMPDPVQAALGAVIAAGAAFAAGYLAEHTDRPDLEHIPRHAADDSGYSAIEMLVGALVLIFLVFAILTLTGRGVC